MIIYEKVRGVNAINVNRLYKIEFQTRAAL